MKKEKTKKIDRVVEVFENITLLVDTCYAVLLILKIFHHAKDTSNL